MKEVLRAAVALQRATRTFMRIDTMSRRGGVPIEVHALAAGTALEKLGNLDRAIGRVSGIRSLDVARLLRRRR